MLAVTEAAGAHLAQLLRKHGAPGEMAVRFVCEGVGIALEMDDERADDTAYLHEGRTVLLLDTRVSELLADDTLDMQGERLTLLNPKDGAPRRP